ncbi:MAG: hypothetical protein KC553_02485 [Nitrospina sp.]|nr:hypothetical protein [Nitrospina sp.]
MFYEVRVKEANGSLKKVLPSKTLSREFWKNFDQSESNISLISTGQKAVPKWVKKNLDLLYPETFEINYY